MLTLPLHVLGEGLLLSSDSSFSSIISKTRLAQAIADCNSVTTPEISLNGLVYWFAYDKKQEIPPTVSQPFMANTAPTAATAAYTILFTNLVHGFVSDE